MFLVIFICDDKIKTLLFEVSLDQLKTQFVDTGKITDSEFTEIIDASGGKTAYATWLTKQVTSKIIKPEDLYKYKSYFKIFDRRKREYVYLDINQYKSPQDIAQFISKSVEIGNNEKADPSQQKGVSKTDRYVEFKIGEVAGFNVYELPKGRKDLYGTSCEIGSGTEWCTATGKTREHFDYYISEGPLFIFIKPGSTEKYQFSYEAHEFMDKNDNSVINNPTDIIRKLFEFIEAKRPEYKIPVRVKYILDPMSLPEHYDKDLDLSNSKIESLGNLRSVNGELNLQGTQIESLGNLESIGWDLDLRGTKIKSLGNLQSIGRNLDLRETPISKKYSEDEIRKMVTVKGKIYL